MVKKSLPAESHCMKLISSAILLAVLSSMSAGVTFVFDKRPDLCSSPTAAVSSQRRVLDAPVSLACAAECLSSSPVCSVYEYLPSNRTCVLGNSCDLLRYWQENSGTACDTHVLRGRKDCNETTGGNATATLTTSTNEPTTTTTTPTTTATTPTSTTTITTPTTSAIPTTRTTTKATTVAPVALTAPPSSGGATDQHGSALDYSPPVSGACYQISAWGARGGQSSDGSAGGKGAFKRANFILSSADALKIVVGKPGNDGSGGGGGGGGGTFIYKDAGGHLLLAAGGGGGGGGGGSPSSAGNSGIANSVGPCPGSTAGAGGDSPNDQRSGAGGGGWSSPGINRGCTRCGFPGAAQFSWTGGNGDGEGGFGGYGGGGGGGDTSGSYNGGGGGGGGYSGGCGGSSDTPGGGGFSYAAPSGKYPAGTDGGNNESSGRVEIRIVDSSLCPS